MILTELTPVEQGYLEQGYTLPEGKPMSHVVTR